MFVKTSQLKEAHFLPIPRLNVSWVNDRRAAPTPVEAGDLLRRCPGAYALSVWASYSPALAAAVSVEADRFARRLSQEKMIHRENSWLRLLYAVLLLVGTTQLIERAGKHNTNSDIRFIKHLSSLFRMQTMRKAQAQHFLLKLRQCRDLPVQDSQRFMTKREIFWQKILISIGRPMHLFKRRSRMACFLPVMIDEFVARHPAQPGQLFAICQRRPHLIFECCEKDFEQQILRVLFDRNATIQVAQNGPCILL